MKKDNYFLWRHQEFINNSGKLPHGCGLCAEVGRWRGNANLNAACVFQMFEPTDDDYHQLLLDGFSIKFWGSGLADDMHLQKRIAYTPLRQTIILLCHEVLNSEE